MAPIALHNAPAVAAHQAHQTSNLKRKPRVFTLEPLHSRALELAREKFDLVLPDDPAFETWRTEAEGLMARNAEVTAEDIKVLSANKLRYISKQGVGVDNFDVDELKKYNLPLMNTPGVNATAVAELALSLIMDVARKVSTIDSRIRRGTAVTKLDGWSGQTLRGKTLGLIGGGNIGFCLGKMFALAFNANIIIFDLYISAEGRQKFVTDMDDLLTSADIVSLHVPLTKATTNLIAGPQLAKMKPSSILINTARGGIVNEDDLCAALESNQIFGAGLDAFVNEPPSLAKYERMCKLDNLVMTPHIGAATADAQQETCLSMVEHLVEAFEGKAMRDRVC